MLSKDAFPVRKISLFFRCFSHIFVIATQLPPFSNSRFAKVKEFFNVNIFFKCKYKSDFYMFA